MVCSLFSNVGYTTTLNYGQNSNSKIENAGTIASAGGSIYANTSVETAGSAGFSSSSVGGGSSSSSGGCSFSCVA